jgi:soluble lytic murein transglycosylase-like protein
MEPISHKLDRVLDRIADIESRLRELNPQYTPSTKSSSTDARFADMLFGLEGGSSHSAQLDWPVASTSVASGVETPTDVAGLVQRAATEHGIRPSLLQAIMQTESGGNPRAVSPRGALGLMQLMPETATSLGVTDPFDPEQNADGGVRYLAAQLQRFGDVKQALAAYNAGPNRVASYGGVPPIAETQRYVQRVLEFQQEERAKGMP